MNRALEQAVLRIEDSTERIKQAAGQAEEAAMRIAHMLEAGYGGNGVRLIELLEAQVAPQELLDALAFLCAEAESQCETPEAGCCRCEASGLVRAWLLKQPKGPKT